MSVVIEVSGVPARLPQRQAQRTGSCSRYDARRLWEERVTALKIGEFLDPDDVLSSVMPVCKSWMGQVRSNDVLWHRYAQRDLASDPSQGPFARFDQKEFGVVMSQRMSHFAFLPPHSTDTRIWDYRFCREDNWQLSPHPNGGFLELYEKFYGKWRVCDNKAQKVSRRASALQRAATARWESWTGRWRQVFGAIFLALVLAQCVLLPLALDARVVLIHNEDGSASNQPSPALAQCPDGEWRLCAPWWMIFLPTAALWFLCQFPLLAFAPLYCAKRRLRQHVLPLLDRTPAHLRKVAVAEFSFDRPPGRTRSFDLVPPRPVAAAIDGHAQPAPPGVVHPAARVGWQPRGLLLGYRLICKMLASSLCTLAALTLALWEDGLIGGAKWICTLWLYPCPLVIPLVVPWSEWKRRGFSVGVLAGFWWMFALMLTLQIGAVVPVVGSWVYFAIGVPLISVVMVLSDPHCDLAAMPPVVQNGVRETASVFFGVLAVASIWASAIIVGGRMDAEIGLTWTLCFIPIWITVTFYATASFLDPL